MRLPTLCLAAALLLAAGGCGDEPAAPAGPLVQEGVSTAESGAPCVPAGPASEPLPPSYPAGLELPPGSVVTFVGQQAGLDLVSGRVEGTVEQVLEHFRVAAPPAGLVVIRDEEEGSGGRLQLFGAAVEVGVTVAQRRCPAGSTGFTVQVRVP